MAGKLEILEKVLRDLKNTGGINSAVIGSRDGLVIASNMIENAEPETLTAMSATMFGSAETSMTELAMKSPKKVLTETDDEDKLIVIGAGPKALLMVTAAGEVGPGLIILQMEKAAKKIKAILEE